jgi:hypothetical protein
VSNCRLQTVHHKLVECVLFPYFTPRNPICLMDERSLRSTTVHRCGKYYHVDRYHSPKFIRKWYIYQYMNLMVVGMFICARLLVGIGIPFAIIGASCLVAEISYPKERPFMTSLFNATWFIGSMAAGGTTLATFNIANDLSWRIPSAIQGIPSFFQILTILYFPLRRG